MFGKALRIADENDRTPDIFGEIVDEVFKQSGDDGTIRKSTSRVGSCGVEPTDEVWVWRISNWREGDAKRLLF